MAKIGLKDFSKELTAALNKAKADILSDSNMQAIGEELKTQIKLRTRLGDGLSESEGEPSKLRPLSPKYIESRRGVQLSEQTKPGKSNLTLTGEMLDSLVAKVQGAVITITFSNQFSKDKARWNTDKGRPFLFISRVQVERLRNSIDKKLNELINKYLK